MATTPSSPNYLGNGNEGSRPVSYYDNFGSNENTADVKDYSAYGYEDDKYDQLRNEMLGFERAKSPTQTVSLLTTVPQNIAAINIAGRHAPTRNSLRHSRMIVTMNRTGKVPRKSMPPILRFHKVAKALVGLQVFLGVAICVIAFWLFIWTPTLRIRDNPYWSGIPLLLSGSIGVLLLCCCRKEYPGMNNGICIYSFKVISIFLSTVAAGTCLIAFTFALRHIVSLLLMDCEPIQILNDTCLCNLSNSTIPTIFLTKSYHYMDLHCPEVHSLFFIFLLISSCTTNFISGILCLWYIYLHWSSRYLYTYSKVHTNILRPTIIYNT